MQALSKMPWSRHFIFDVSVIAADSFTTRIAVYDTVDWYSERLPQAGIEPSGEKVGDRHYNALAETIEGLYKAEGYRSARTMERPRSGRIATLEWVDWFKHRRLLEPVGNMPPAEAEERCYAMLDEAAMAV